MSAPTVVDPLDAVLDVLRVRHERARVALADVHARHDRYVRAGGTSRSVLDGYRNERFAASAALRACDGALVEALAAVGRTP